MGPNYITYSLPTVLYMDGTFDVSCDSMKTPSGHVWPYSIARRTHGTVVDRPITMIGIDGGLGKDKRCH